MTDKPRMSEELIEAYQHEGSRLSPISRTILTELLAERKRYDILLGAGPYAEVYARAEKAEAELKLLRDVEDAAHEIGVAASETEAVALYTLPDDNLRYGAALAALDKWRRENDG